MRDRTLLSAVLVFLVAGVLLALTAPAAAQNPGPGEINLTLSPSDPEVDQGGQLNYSVIIEGADAGVDSYLLNLELEDASVANITEVNENRTNLSSTEIGANNSSVKLGQALLDNSYDGANSPFDIANITVNSTGPVNANTSFVFNQSANQVVTENGSTGKYNVSAFNDAAFNTSGPTLNFNDQPLSDDGTVEVENIDTDGISSAVLVTFPNPTGGNPIVAGVKTPANVSEGSISVAIENASGFPGPHTAHIVPDAGASKAYEPNDTVSGATLANITESETAEISQAGPEPGPQPAPLQNPAPSEVDETNIVGTTITGGLTFSTSQVSSTAVDGLTILDDYPQNGASIFDPNPGSVFAATTNTTLESEIVNATDERFAPVAVGQHTGIVGLPVQTDTFSDAEEFLNFQQQQDIAAKPEQQVAVTFEIDGSADADTQTITANFDQPAEAGLEINDTLSSVSVVANGSNDVVDTSISPGANEITATLETNNTNDSRLVADVVYEPADPVEGLDVDGGVNDLAVIGEGPDGDTERDRFLAVEVGATAISHADVDRAAASGNNGFIGEPVEDDTGTGVNLSSVNDPNGQANPGSFLIHQDQVVTFETASRDNTIEIFEAVQREDGNEVVHAEGDRVARLGTAPGQIANLNTSTLDPGQYFVDFESSDDNNAVVLDVQPLNLNASAPTDIVSETDTVGIDVTTDDITGSDIQARILEAGDNEVKDVIHVERDTLPGTGNRTILIDPENDLNGTGTYYAVVEHSESEVTATTDTFEVGQPANFSVGIVNAPSSVVVGDQIAVDFTVENTGDVAGTQDITFDVNNTQEDVNASVALVAGNTLSDTFTFTASSSDTPQVTTTVASADDSASDTVTVNEPPNFDVSITNVPSAVTEGETVVADYEVTNTGDLTDTQDIVFTVDGALEATEAAVTLNGSETFAGQFNYSTGASDVPQVNVSVSSEGSSANRTVSVTERANFSVSIDSTNAPVVAGENLTVNVTVSNTGGQFGTQTLGLAVGNLGNSSTTVSADVGVSKTKKLSIPVASGDTGVFTATVFTANDSDSTSVTVQTPANFAVSILDTNTPVAGEQLNVTASVQNLGDVPDTQTITLELNERNPSDTSVLDSTDSANVTLPGDGSTNLTLSVETSAGDAGAFTATVSSADDTASVDVVVQGPANFSVSGVEPADATVVSGEETDVSAVVANTGSRAGAQNITLRIEDNTGTEVLNRTRIRQLVAGGNTVVVFGGVDTSALGPGEFTLTVSSANDSASGTLTVRRVASVTFDDQSVPAGSSTVTVDADLPDGGFVAIRENVEQTDGIGNSTFLPAGTSQNVSITLDRQLDRSSQTLTAVAHRDTDDDQRYDFARSAGEVDVPYFDPGTGTVTDSATVNTTDEADTANFTVTILPAESTLSASAGGQVEVVADVENIGTAGAAQTVELLVGTQQRAQQTVELGPGGRTTVTLAAGVGVGDDGATVSLRTANDTASATVGVQAPANFDVSLAGLPGSVTVGTELTVGYEVTNTGETIDRQEILFRVEGDIVESVTERLAVGRSVSGEFTYRPVEPSTALEVTVASGDDVASADVTVERPAPSARVPARVQFGETTVESSTTREVELTNTGEVPLTLSTVEVVEGEAFTLENTADRVELNESRTLAVTYAPETAGNDSGRLLVTGSGGEFEETVTLSGTAVPPVRGVALDPSSVQFPSVTVGDSITREVELTNTGEVPLALDTTAAGEGFSVTGVGTVAPGQRETVTVTYAPGASGRDTGLVRVTDTEERVNRTVSLSGTALLPDPELRVDSESVQFPETAVGETVTETVTVENVGDAALTVTRTRIDEGEVFALVDGGTDGGFTLGAGESRTLTVSFTPDAEQSYTDYLSVESATPAVRDRTIALTSAGVRVTVESNGTADTLNASVAANASESTESESTEISFPDVPDSQQYRTESLSVVPVNNTDIEIIATTSNETLEEIRETTGGTDAGFSDNITRLGNISVSASVDNEDIERAEFTATIDRSQFETDDTNASDISFYRFDEQLREWVEQNTTVVERTETTVTVTVVGDGFSEWTAAAARPEFNIDNAEVNVTTATVGEVVEIDVFVTNTGGTDGTYVAELLLNGRVVEEQTAIIASRGQENFLFQRSIDNPGEYEVQVNEAFVATVNITESGAEVEDQPPDNDTDTGGGDGFGPGFGIPIAVVAVLVGLGAFYARQRDTGS